MPRKAIKLHIYNDQEKFSVNFFRLLQMEGFDLSEQLLFHYGRPVPEFDALGVRTVWARNYFSPLPNIRLLFLMFRAERIFIHSLAAPSLLLYLWAFERLRRKSCWIVWGKDLYYYALKPRHNLADRIYEYFRRRVFPRMPTLVTLVGEDHAVAQTLYGVTGRHIEGNFTEGILWRDLPVSPGADENAVVVLLGNSASETNNHLEALELLRHNREQVAEIVCFLSYGGPGPYVRAVLDAGHRAFADRFRGIVEYLDEDQYLGALQHCDVGVFNHHRQEGLTAIIYMIYLKKTLYLNPRSSTWKFFRRIGIRVHDIAGLGTGPLRFLDDATLESNRNIIRERFMDVRKFSQLWRGLFETPLP